MASSDSYLADADNVRQGLETIGDLKIYIEFIASLPTNIKQYSKRFKLTEDVVGTVRNNLDSVLAVHEGLRERWNAFNEKTFQDVVGLIHGMLPYGDHAKKSCTTIAQALLLLKSLEYPEDRPGLVTIIENLIKRETIKLQQFIDRSDQLISKIKEFHTHSSVDYESVSVHTSFDPAHSSSILRPEVDTLKTWVDAFNELPPSTRSKAMDLGGKKVWVPFVGLVIDGLLKNPRISPSYNKINDYLEKPDKDAKLAAEQLTLHSELVQRTLKEAGDSLQGAVRSVENIRALFRHTKLSLDDVRVTLENVPPSSETHPFNFKVDTEVFEAMRKGAANFLTGYYFNYQPFYGSDGTPDPTTEISQ